MVARFRETIPTVKFVSSSEIKKNFSFYRNYDFTIFKKIRIFPGFTFSPPKKEFRPEFSTIATNHIHMQRALYHACKLVI